MIFFICVPLLTMSASLSELGLGSAPPDWEEGGLFYRQVGEEQEETFLL